MADKREANQSWLTTKPIPIDEALARIRKELEAQGLADDQINTQLAMAEADIWRGVAEELGKRANLLTKGVLLGDWNIDPGDLCD